MATRKTCDKCEHFTPNPTYTNLGDCALMGDSNDEKYSHKTKRLGTTTDKAFGWDYESYQAGVFVGRKFGCIHWVRRAPATTKETP